MEVLWKGAFGDPSGYGHAARGYLYALHKAGVNIKAFDKRHDCMEAELSPEEKKIMDVSLVKEAPGNSNIIIHHCTPEFYERHRNRYNIAYCAWETSKIPDLWVEKMNSHMDRIWVPCSHNKRVFEECGVVRPVEVIPHGLNAGFFKPGLQPLNVLNLRSFVFLSVFQWTERKAWKTLLRSYYKAFRPEEDVCLFLKVYRSNVSIQEQRAIKKDIEMVKRELGMIKTPPIVFYGHLLPNELLPNLYNTCDCFVLPTRGEGFGLPIAEAMSCGKPVIATNCSSIPDIVNSKNGYLINCKMVPVQHMPHTPWYEPTQLWGDPEQEHLIGLLRRAFTHQAELKKKGEMARKTVEKYFTWDAVAKKIIKSLNSIIRR